jgi:hypothetical protein
VKEIPLISPSIRAIIDNILFVSVYGHKSLWETRTRAFRASVLAQILVMKEAKDKENAFYASWKDFCRRFSIQQEAAPEEHGLDEEIMQEFFDDPPPPVAAAAAASDDDGK